VFYTPVQPVAAVGAVKRDDSGGGADDDNSQQKLRAAPPAGMGSLLDIQA